MGAAEAKRINRERIVKFSLVKLVRGLAATQYCWTFDSLNGSEEFA